MDLSKRFLTSYLDTLIGIAQNSLCDPIKGKGPVVADYGVVQLRTANQSVSSAVNHMKWISPSDGWVKLNTGGSWSSHGSAGAGMILRDSTGNIFFSSCKELLSCRDAIMEAE